MIRIEDNGEVKLINRIVYNSTDMQTIINELQSLEASFPILPHNCHSISTINGESTYIIEVKPGIRRLDYARGNDRIGNLEIIKSYKVYIPWMYCVISTTENTVFRSCCRFSFSGKRVTSMDTKMFLLTYPTSGLYDNTAQMFCTVHDGGLSSNSPLHEKINEEVDSIVSIPFAYSYLTLVVYPYIQPIEKQLIKLRESKSNTDTVKYMRAWEEATKELGAEGMEKVFIDYARKKQSISCRDLSSFTFQDLWNTII